MVVNHAVVPWSSVMINRGFDNSLAGSAFITSEVMSEVHSVHAQQLSTWTCVVVVGSGRERHKNAIKLSRSQDIRSSTKLRESTRRWDSLVDAGAAGTSHSFSLSLSLTGTNHFWERL